MKTRTVGDGDEDALIALWAVCGLLKPWNDPVADIALARKNPTSDILVAEKDGKIVASAMAGFDGHRGWVYYVAVLPEARGAGAGKQVMAAAETYLRSLGCPKVELMVRGNNETAIGFYEAIGYDVEDRVLMANWLVEPPTRQDEIPQLDVTVTFLAMDSAPTSAPRRAPSTGTPLALQRLHKPTIGFYRYIHHTVGNPWLWYSRRQMSDSDVLQIVQDPLVEVYLLSEGGVPAGFIELDFRQMPKEADIAYFGLFPDFIGRGFGPYLLDCGIRTAWDRSPTPGRLTVNTCTLDHPSALGLYQKMGFVPYAREEQRIPDPQALGLVPQADSEGS